MGIPDSTTCGEACIKDPVCCSYEWSPTTKHCNFIKECQPTQGKFQDYIFCSRKVAPIDCEWSEWQTLDPCSKTCGGGTMRQSRTIKTYPENGGKKCEGQHIQTKACNTGICETEDVTKCHDGFEAL